MGRVVARGRGGTRACAVRGSGARAFSAKLKQQAAYYGQLGKTKLWKVRHFFRTATGTAREPDFQEWDRSVGTGA